MKNITTFQYTIPQPKFVKTPLSDRPIPRYQKPLIKAPLYGQFPVSYNSNYSPAVAKDFIPRSLTITEQSQIRPMFNKIKPVNIVNINPIQATNNLISANSNYTNTVPSVQIATIPKYSNINIIRPRPISQSSVVINPNFGQRINNKIITNNNIINSQVSINNISNYNYEKNNRPIQFPNYNNYVQYTAPRNILGMNRQPIPNSIIPYQNNSLNPGELLNLKEYEILGEIGKGSFGKIYKVKWKVNQKFYALKNELLDDMEGINTRLDRGRAMRNFIQSTGCPGVVNIYGSYLIKQGKEFHYFELMDLCETDFEKEIKMRSNYGTYYTEGELDNIIKQLISTLSFLQKRHITHRDIKPQNILIANGKYKLCDFGDIRVMKRDGIVVQRIRGSELYMSPILFYGLRRGVQTIEHNTYKSDVFSLGMCLFYAACLSYDGPVEIREVIDMNMKYQILNKYLGARYSQKLIKILHLMLQTEESARPDFILLEEAIMKYGL